MPHKHTDNKPSDQTDERFNSFVDEQDDVKRVKLKGQGVVEADDQKKHRNL